jgi:hypothetical protein
VNLQLKGEKFFEFCNAYHKQKDFQHVRKLKWEKMMKRTLEKKVNNENTMIYLKQIAKLPMDWYCNKINIEKKA